VSGQRLTEPAACVAGGDPPGRWLQVVPALFFYQAAFAQRLEKSEPSIVDFGNAIVSVSLLNCSFLCSSRAHTRGDQHDCKPAPRLK